MPKNVLITGASGLIGTRLTELLQQKGYQVSHLSRNQRQGTIPTFVWDVENMNIDSNAFHGIDAIVHLAGAGIADKPWTKKRKTEILESRTKSANLLFQSLKNQSHSVECFISASAIGYYGDGGADKTFKEGDPATDDFLGTVVQSWEQAADKFANLNIRVAKLRIGILLSAKGGALAEIARPIKWGVGSPLGSGKQFMSWIHIDDACHMFIKALEEKSMHGAYNAVAPTPATNEEVTRRIAKVLGKPLWLPNVPGFVLKFILGEMATLVLGGSKVSSEKIQQAGFQFSFTDLEKALVDLLKRPS